MVRKHRRDVRLAHPAHTTMDCASCGARTKHAPPVGTPNCCRSAPTPAPRAEPPVPGTRTPPA
jgi:putative transposase